MRPDGDISSMSWKELAFKTESNMKANSLHSVVSKKRKRIIIVTVITILSLAVIVTIMTRIFLLKSNDTINQTSTPSTNLNVYTTSVAGALIYDVGNGGISDDPPCSSHTVMHDPSRNVEISGIGGACDNGPSFNTSIGGRWIRFLGKGGTMIPSTSPGEQHCSAYLAGWSNVTLPSTNGTIINGVGCFEIMTSTCAFQTHIKIINCGTFYVYFLTPVSSCNARYCTI